jgi:phage shock protein PspC (stress-responsive transcriptional regulator)
MRKTLNINLGGLAFIIDENAFELLHTYLEALKRKFNNATEREEILNDIETRIAEMLNQKLASRKEVVGLEDVQFVTEAMGKPEDIAGEDAEEEIPSQPTTGTSNQSGTQTVHKKLFRDPDDAKIGGVISGLCHYFGISDPVWMRIAAIILVFLTSGTVILLYLLLLIVVPKASTAAEKLQMKGEPININTIEKEIKDAATRATESVHKLVNDQNFFEKVWEVFLAVIRTFGRVFGLFIIGISMLCLFALSISFFVLYAMNSSDFSEATRMLVDSHTTLVIFSIGFLLFFGAPLVALIYLGLKLMLGERSRVKWLKTALLILWLAGLVLLGTTAYKIGANFKMEGSKNETIALMQPAKGNLYVQIASFSGKKANADNDDEDDYHDINIDLDGIFVNGINLKDLQRIPVGRPKLEIVPSENDSFYIQELITSQGRNKMDAQKNAEMVNYTFSQTDSILSLSPQLYLEKGNKYRAQRIKIKLAIPEGKSLRFADNIDAWAVTAKGVSSYDDKDFNNTLWIVKKGQLKCLNEQKQEDDKQDVENQEEHEKPAHKKEHKKDKDEEKDKDNNEDF